MKWCFRHMVFSPQETDEVESTTPPTGGRPAPESVESAARTILSAASVGGGARTRAGVGGSLREPFHKEAAIYILADAAAFTSSRLLDKKWASLPLGPPRGRRWTRSVSASHAKEGSAGTTNRF